MKEFYFDYRNEFTITVSAPNEEQARKYLESGEVDSECSIVNIVINDALYPEFIKSSSN